MNWLHLLQVIQQKSEECDHIKFLIEEKDSEEEAFNEDLDGFEENGTQETRISPYTFCKAFPFHLMFDKDLMLTQCGNAIYRVLPQVCTFFLHLLKEFKPTEKVLHFCPPVLQLIHVSCTPAPAWQLHPSISVFFGPASYRLQFSWNSFPHKHGLCSAE